MADRGQLRVFPEGVCQPIRHAVDVPIPEKFDDCFVMAPKGRRLRGGIHQLRFELQAASAQSGHAACYLFSQVYFP